jgi:Protein of unknown function (DUF3011)
MKKVLFGLSMVLLAVLLSPLFLNSSGATVAGATPNPYSYRFYCASDDFYRHFCSIETRGRVQIVRQRSEASCIYGRTWGVAGNGVWVDRGCRAEFAVGTGEYAFGGGYGVRTFYCSSDDFNFRGCRVNTYGGVRLIRQRSESPCVFGQTWGFDDRGVWVDRGCRADTAAVTAKTVATTMTTTATIGVAKRRQSVTVIGQLASGRFQVSGNRVIRI